MVLAQQVLFLLVSIFAIGLFARKMSSLRRTIFLGKKEPINDRKSARWKQVVLLALGQKKLFKKPIPAIFHFFVYAGFILINIEVLEILVDGSCGTERAFAPYLGSLYPLAINFFEILAVLVLVGVIAFWLRRNVLRLKRFTSPELQGAPLKDANRILYIEIVLMSMLLLMNAADPHAHHGEHHLQAVVAAPYRLNAAHLVGIILTGLNDRLVEPAAHLVHLQAVGNPDFQRLHGSVPPARSGSRRGAPSQISLPRWRTRAESMRPIRPPSQAADRTATTSTPSFAANGTCWAWSRPASATRRPAVRAFRTQPATTAVDRGSNRPPADLSNVSISTMPPPAAAAASMMPSGVGAQARSQSA
jgi:nitrate reductase gamma subunit